jgi:hypothetical protein
LSVVKDNEAATALYREPRALKGAGGYADEVLLVCFLAKG